MKTNRFYTLLLLAVSVSCFTACEKNDDLFPDQDEETNTLKFVTYQDSVQIATKLAYQALSAPDSTLYDKLDAGDIQLKPDYGTLIHNATPSIRYVTASSFEQARQFFISDFLSTIVYLKADTTNAEITLNLGQQGYISFSPENGDGNVAKIDVNLKQLDDLTMVYFILPEAWPQNGVQAIAQGNTFISLDGLNYICIKDAHNREGYLVTFDMGCDRLLNYTDGNMLLIKDPTLETAHNPDYYAPQTYQAYIHTGGMANCEQLRSLQGFLYDTNGRARESSKQSLKRILSDQVLNAIYSSGKVFVCGEGYWYKRTDNKYKYTSYYYSMRKRKILTETIKSTYYWGSNRFFVMYPSFYECRFEDWRFDTFNVARSYITYYNVYMSQTGYVDTNVNPSWNYRCGLSDEKDNFIRMRCITFGDGFDYNAAGLRKTDVFTRKTTF